MDDTQIDGAAATAEDADAPALPPSDSAAAPADFNGFGGLRLRDGAWYADDPTWGEVVLGPAVKADAELGRVYIAGRDQATAEGPAAQRLRQGTVAAAAQPAYTLAPDDRPAQPTRQPAPAPVVSPPAVPPRGPGPSQQIVSQPQGSWQDAVDGMGRGFTRLIELDKRIVTDVGRGLVEAPVAVVRGVAGGLGNIFSLADDLANWLNDNVVDLRIPVPESLRGTLLGDILVANPAAELSKAAKDIAGALPAPETITGGIVEFAGEWLAGAKLAKGVAEAAD